MLAARSVDGSAEAFRSALRESLVREVGEHGWAEWDFDRDIWYANLVHFATDLTDPEALIEWIDSRRDLDLGETTIEDAQLWRYVFEHGRPRPPHVLASEPLHA